MVRYCKLSRPLCVNDGICVDVYEERNAVNTPSRVSIAFVVDVHRKVLVGEGFDLFWSISEKKEMQAGELAAWGVVISG